MRPSSSKEKGRRLQKIVVSSILEEFGGSLTENDVRSTSMGCNGEDILLSERGKELLPFSFECKNQEAINIWKAIDQCRSNASEKDSPCVVFKKNGEEPFAALPWKTLLLLLSRRRKMVEGEEDTRESSSSSLLKRTRDSLSKILEEMERKR